MIKMGLTARFDPVRNRGTPAKETTAIARYCCGSHLSLPMRLVQLEGVLGLGDCGRSFAVESIDELVAGAEDYGSGESPPLEPAARWQSLEGLSRMPCSVRRLPLTRTTAYPVFDCETPVTDKQLCSSGPSVRNVSHGSLGLIAAIITRRPNGAGFDHQDYRSFRCDGFVHDAFRNRHTLVGA